MGTTSVIHVDDNDLVRSGLRRWSLVYGDWEVAADFPSAQGVVEAVVRSRPQVVLMDLDMPGVDTLDLIREVVAALPGVAVVMLSGFCVASQITACLDAGASGYLSKDTPIGELSLYIQRAARGEFVACPLTIRALAARA